MFACFILLRVVNYSYFFELDDSEIAANINLLVNISKIFSAVLIKRHR